ncbi:MAG: ribosomal protein S18-alanine N-acetyltransferase [Clostridiales bacterium]|nr:ribosomal protein S18-alanine N-acetyltransferase [Clostridiales bacterium]
MPESLVLRQLLLDDLDDILTVEQLSFSDPWSRESYIDELSKNQLAYYCGCLMNGYLVGFGGFWQILTEGHITNVAVRPDYRSQGIGRLLVAHMVAACRALGGTDMTLEVRQSNMAAQALYGKFGFKSVGIRPHYYNNQESALMMWAKL